MRGALLAGVTLALLALIEAGLAVAGVEGLLAGRDPFAGFSQRVRVFRAEPARGGGPRRSPGPDYTNRLRVWWRGI
jgi:hypothetical protein